MRGLAHFIRDIRETTGDKRMEEQRVTEELAKIKSKFIREGQMTLYDRKKYVCKLMFITMLGYPVEFGHLEGLKLMAEEAASEKLIGYLSITVLLNENSPMITLATHTIYRDLLSGIDFNVGLALTAISNIGDRGFLEAMHNGVQEIVLKGSCNAETLKKSILTLLCVFRKFPGFVDLPLIIETISKYLESSSESLVMACVSFMLGSVSSETKPLFSTVVPLLLKILSRTIIEKKTEPRNMYYGVQSPWLQTKILGLLQFLDPPTDPVELSLITEALRRTIQSTERVLAEAQTQQKQRGTSNRVNVMISIFAEVFSLIIRWELGMSLMQEAVNIVERFVVNKRKANIRYIGLALLPRLRMLETSEFNYFALCQQFEQNVVVALHESDLSIRIKALNVLVSMCNNGNAPEIVKELLSYLRLGHSSLFRAKLFLCIAYLAEEYFERESSQYIDVMMAAIKDADDASHPSVVQLLVHTVVNNPNIQKRAATVAFRALAQKRSSNEELVKVAGFFLGEYGCQIALNPESSPIKQVQVIQHQLAFAANTTQGVLLHALLKSFCTYENAKLREKILKVFRKCSFSSCLQVQQWSREYLSLIENSSAGLLSSLIEPMPPFPLEQSKRISSLIQRAGGMWISTFSRPTGSGVAFADPNALKPIPLDEIIPLKELKDQHQKAGKTPCAIPDRFSAFQTPTSEIEEKTHALRTLNATLFQRFLKGESQLLFQDDFIEITCRQKFFYENARMGLAISQKAAGAEGSSVAENPEIDIAAVDAGLLLEMRLVESSSSPSPLSFPVNVELAARSTYPFAWSPSIRVAYTAAGQSYLRIIMLPFVTTHFIVPYDLGSVPEKGSTSLALEQVREKINAEGKSPLTCSIACKSGISLTEEFLEGLLKKLGYTVSMNSAERMDLYLADAQSQNRMTVIGVGAHSCFGPTSSVRYSPVLVELQFSRMAIEILVSITAANACLQEGVLTSLKLHLCT